jgi:hypothetical protein
MRMNTKFEESVGAWFWRLLLGPAQVLDGVITICTLTFVSGGLALACSRALARARLNKLLEGRV